MSTDSAKYGRRSCGVLIALAVLCCGSTAWSRPGPPAGLDAYVHRAMTLWQVPGLAVGIVKDGHVIMARGYGVRVLGKPERVNANTLFTIGSNSKAFTVAALGTLVAHGKLRWHDHIVKFVPAFRLSSPYRTQEATIRDLLAHRTGYCDPTNMWYAADDTTANIIERLRYQKPTYGFRAHFCYNNTMYLVAAQVIAKITGIPWGRYVTEHLLAPLQMTRTETSVAALDDATDVAAPHGEVNGTVKVIRRYWANNMNTFAPVGGINSSVADMNHWLEMLLADGRYRGRTVLPAAIIKAMETPQEPIQADTQLGQWLRTQTPHAHFYAYGLGFVLQTYGGHKLIWHPGDIDGMASSLALIPAEHLGVVVLSNMNENRAAEGVMFYVLQSYLGLAHHDVSRVMYDVARKAREARRAAQRRLAATRIRGAKPALALGLYVGTYSDKFYGAARVSEFHGHLVLHLGNPMFTGDLQFWHDETFRVRWRYRFYGDAYVTFRVSALRSPTQLRLQLPFAQTPNHYERRALHARAQR